METHLQRHQLSPSESRITEQVTPTSTKQHSLWFLPPYLPHRFRGTHDPNRALKVIIAEDLLLFSVVWDLGFPRPLKTLWSTFLHIFLHRGNSGPPAKQHANVFKTNWLKHRALISIQDNREWPQCDGSPCVRSENKESCSPNILCTKVEPERYGILGG